MDAIEPARVARAYREWFAGYAMDPGSLLSRTSGEAGGYDDMQWWSEAGRAWLGEQPARHPGEVDGDVQPRDRVGECAGLWPDGLRRE